MNEEKLKWQTPEYIYREKTADWYWIVSIVTISIALIAIILNNIIFALLIIASSFTLSLFASRKPSVIDVRINNSGIIAGNTKYTYDSLDSFWVETREAYPKVLVKSKKLLMPFIVILINGVEPSDVKHALEKYLPEKEHAEPFLEKLLIYFGF